MTIPVLLTLVFLGVGQSYAQQCGYTVTDNEALNEVSIPVRMVQQWRIISTVQECLKSCCDSDICNTANVIDYDGKYYCNTAFCPDENICVWKSYPGAKLFKNVTTGMVLSPPDIQNKTVVVIDEQDVRDNVSEDAGNISNLFQFSKEAMQLSIGDDAIAEIFADNSTESLSITAMSAIDIETVTPVWEFTELHGTTAKTVISPADANSYTKEELPSILQRGSDTDIEDFYDDLDVYLTKLEQEAENLDKYNATFLNTSFAHQQQKNEPDPTKDLKDQQLDAYRGPSALLIIFLSFVCIVIILTVAASIRKMRHKNSYQYVPVHTEFEAFQVLEED